MATHKTLTGLAKTKKAPAAGGFILIGAIIALVTFIKLTQTYGEFWKDAFDAPGWIVALLILNLLAGGILISLLVLTVKPTNWIPYAAVVALSLFTYFSTPIALETLAGSDVADKPASIKVSDLYSPIDKIVSAEVDKPVRKAKSGEIEKVVAKYEKAGKNGKRTILDRVDSGLAGTSKSSTEKSDIKAAVGMILENTKGGPYRARLREVAQTLYVADQRQIVQDLAR
jgi:hypothetical protein